MSILKNLFIAILSHKIF